jgi:hypothetical protein
MPIELHWVAWKSIPNHTRSLQHVLSSSAWAYKRRRACLFQITNGAELDTLISRTRRHPTGSKTDDVTVVLIVKRPRHNDTVSFANTKYVTINGISYLMKKELFVFVAKQMPFNEASRLLQDTTDYE